MSLFDKAFVWFIAAMSMLVLDANMYLALSTASAITLIFILLARAGNKLEKSSQTTAKGQEVQS